MKKYFSFALCTASLVGLTSLSNAQEFKPGQTVQDNQVIQPGDNDRGDNSRADSQRGGTSSQTQGRGSAGTQGSASGVQASNAAGQQSRYQDQGLQHHLVRSLVQKNQGEVELSQLAQQHSQNQQVKDFAKQMIDSHTKLISQLNEQTQSSPGEHSTSSGASNSNQGQSGVGGASGAGGAGSDSNARTTQRAEGLQQGSRDSDSERGTNLTPGNSTQANGSHSDRMTGGASVDSQLASVLHEACAKHQQMTREMLTQHKGSEFDMAYIGQQIAAHTMMIADLEAFANHGDAQFQQLVGKARTEAQHHLDMAKSIKDGLKGQQQQR